MDRRAKRLRRVIDHANVFPRGQFRDPFDVGGIAKKVRHNDRAGFLGQYRSHRLDRKIELFTDVRQNRRRARR